MRQINQWEDMKINKSMPFDGQEEGDEMRPAAIDAAAAAGAGDFM